MSKYKFMRLTALFLSVIMLFNTVVMDVLATGADAFVPAGGGEGGSETGL